MSLSGWLMLSWVSGATLSAPAQDASTSAAPVHEDPSPWSQRRSGRGLALGSAAAGTVGWGMALGVVSLRRQDCGFEGCVYQLLSRSIVRALANGTALGLAIPAGIRAGRYDATHAPPSPAFDRRSRAFVAAGAGALAVGAAGWTASMAVRLRVVPRCSGDACFYGYVLGLQSGFALVGTGAGLLSYGLARRGTRNKQPGSPATAASVRVLPTLGLHQTGLTLAGRF